MIFELVIIFKFYKDLLRILLVILFILLLICEFVLLVFVLNKCYCKFILKNYLNKIDFIFKLCDFVI